MSGLSGQDFSLLRHSDVEKHCVGLVFDPNKMINPCPQTCCSQSVVRQVLGRAKRQRDTRLAIGVSVLSLDLIHRKSSVWPLKTSAHPPAFSSSYLATLRQLVLTLCNGEGGYSHGFWVDPSRVAPRSVPSRCWHRPIPRYQLSLGVAPF